MAARIRHGIKFVGYTKDLGFVVRYWHGKQVANTPTSVAEFIQKAGAHLAKRIAKLTKQPVLSIDPLYHFDVPKKIKSTYLNIPKQNLQSDPTISMWNIHKEPARNFVYPLGVVPDVGAGEKYLNNLIPCVDGGKVKGLYFVRALVEREQLFEVFCTLLHFIPTIDNLEVRIHRPQTKKITPPDVWLTPVWSSNEKLARFLSDYRHELFANGWVELSVYSGETHTTLRLAKNKTIWFYAQHRKNRDEVAQLFRKKGFPVKHAVHKHLAKAGYWSYALPQSDHPKRLVEILKNLGAKRI